jgi:hypothetical protein
LMDSLSNLMKKCNSWCMSGYARSQRNFFIRNTGTKCWDCITQCGPCWKMTDLYQAYLHKISW